MLIDNYYSFVYSQVCAGFTFRNLGRQRPGLPVASLLPSNANMSLCPTAMAGMRLKDCCLWQRAVAGTVVARAGQRERIEGEEHMWNPQERGPNPRGGSVPAC